MERWDLSANCCNTCAGERLVTAMYVTLVVMTWRHVCVLGGESSTAPIVAALPGSCENLHPQNDQLTPQSFVWLVAGLRLGSVFQCAMTLLSEIIWLPEVFNLLFSAFCVCSTRGASPWTPPLLTLLSCRKLAGSLFISGCVSIKGKWHQPEDPRTHPLTVLGS